MGASFARQIADGEVISRGLVYGGEIVGPIVAASPNFVALANQGGVMEILTPFNLFAEIRVGAGYASRFYFRVPAVGWSDYTAQQARQILGTAAFQAGLNPAAANVYALTEEPAIRSVPGVESSPTEQPDASVMGRLSAALSAPGRVAGDVAASAAGAIGDVTSTVRTVAYLPLYLAALGVVVIVGWLLFQNRGA